MRGGMSIGVQLILDGDKDVGSTVLFDLSDLTSSTVLSGLTGLTVLSGLSVLFDLTDVVDSLTGVSFLDTDR